MRTRTWLILVTLIFAPLVPRLLGDHLSPPLPGPTSAKCTGAGCK